jgi:hypothetical protein
LASTTCEAEGLHGRALAANDVGRETGHRDSAQQVPIDSELHSFGQLHGHDRCLDQDLSRSYIDLADHGFRLGHILRIVVYDEHVVERQVVARTAGGSQSATGTAAASAAPAAPAARRNHLLGGGGHLDLRLRRAAQHRLNQLAGL